MARPLSLLDLTPIAAGLSATEALREATELAILADQLGYQRVWYAEHHNTTRLASATPEVMIAHVANHTRHLRVGSGGVMLPNHAPLRVIEAFRLLEALHPGRIDLGLGRAPGTDTLTAYAMRRSRQALTGDDYPEQLAELVAYDDGTFPDDHPFRVIKPMPFDVPMPPIWLLGSSDFSAQLAAEAGLAFAFAAHINAHGAIPAMRAYRAGFTPSTRYAAPQSMLTLSVTVGEDATHAAELAHVADLFLLRLRTGQHDFSPTYEEARDYQFTPAERALIASMSMKAISGDAASVHQQITDLADQCQADEVMVTIRLPYPAERRRTLIALARAFGLPERAAVGQPEPLAV